MRDRKLKWGREDAVKFFFQKSKKEKKEKKCGDKPASFNWTYVQYESMEEWRDLLLRTLEEGGKNGIGVTYSRQLLRELLLL